MRVDVSIEIAAPRDVVWGVLANWERQSDWMLDAKSVEVVTPHREGIGVTIHVPTNLLGVTVLDVMRVTDWIEKERIEIIHLGKIITGIGAFEISDGDRPGTTHFQWWEEVSPPMADVPVIGALTRWGTETIVQPFTTWLFKKSLRNLTMVCERAAMDVTEPLALAH